MDFFFSEKLRSPEISKNFDCIYVVRDTVYCPVFVIQHLFGTFFFLVNNNSKAQTRRVRTIKYVCEQYCYESHTFASIKKLHKLITSHTDT